MPKTLRRRVESLERWWVGRARPAHSQELVRRALHRLPEDTLRCLIRATVAVRKRRKLTGEEDAARQAYFAQLQECCCFGQPIRRHLPDAESALDVAVFRQMSSEELTIWSQALRAQLEGRDLTECEAAVAEAYQAARERACQQAGFPSQDAYRRWQSRQQLRQQSPCE
jgi:hypothetical protein